MATPNINQRLLDFKRAAHSFVIAAIAEHSLSVYFLSRTANLAINWVFRKLASPANWWKMIPPTLSNPLTTFGTGNVIILGKVFFAKAASSCIFMTNAALFALETTRSTLVKSIFGFVHRFSNWLPAFGTRNFSVLELPFVVVFDTKSPSEMWFSTVTKSFRNQRLMYAHVLRLIGTHMYVFRSIVSRPFVYMMNHFLWFKESPYFFLGHEDVFWNISFGIGSGMAGKFNHHIAIFVGNTFTLFNNYSHASKY